MQRSVHDQWCFDALGMDPSASAGVDADRETQSDKQADTLYDIQPSPLTKNASAQGPSSLPQSSSPAAASPADSLQPSIDLHPSTTLISAEQVTGLMRALDEAEVQIQEAMAADSAMRSDLKRRNIDVRDKNALADRLAEVVPAVDPTALKALRTAKGLVDTAKDGLLETLIEIETSTERLRNLEKLIGISRKDDAKADDEASKITDKFDLVVSSEKAVIDILPALLDPFAIASGVLEFLGSDMLKGKIKDHYKDLLTKNQELSKHLDEVIVALHRYSQKEIKTETKNLVRLKELKEIRLEHCFEVISDLVSDLGSLPSKGGGTTPPAFEEIMKSYKEVDAESKRMAAIKRIIEKSPALRNEGMLKSLQPIGTFDPKMTKIMASTRIGSNSTFVYVQDSSHVTVFNLPSGMAPTELEGLAARVAKVKLFDSAVDDASVVAKSWKDTIYSKLSM